MQKGVLVFLDQSQKKVCAIFCIIIGLKKLNASPSWIQPCVCQIPNKKITDITSCYSSTHANVDMVNFYFETHTVVQTKSKLKSKFIRYFLAYKKQADIDLES